jgi:hypothetical protein
MAADQPVALIDDHRHPEPECFDALRDLADLFLRVHSGVTWVRLEVADLDLLDLQV